MASSQPELTLYLGTDCHVCGRTGVRHAVGEVLVCDRCDLAELEPPQWPQQPPPS